jgi:exodeoxyribonuclease III
MKNPLIEIAALVRKTLFIITFLVSTNLYSQQINSLKIITYNIWNGYDFGKDQERRLALTNWVNKQTPDVVALQELCNYTDDKLRQDAEKWGHSYYLLLKTTGYSVGITSKYPIELKEKILGGLHHGALHCSIMGIDFLVVHLHPGSIQFRQQEAQILTDKIKKIKTANSKYIVLGDFNSHSPYDADLYDPNGYFLTRLRESNKGKGLNGNIFNNGLDYSVISSFLSLSLVDVTQMFTKGIMQRGSFPTLALSSITKESNELLVERMERIDYILVSPELGMKCKTARVCNQEENWYLSDHYPVIATFEKDL